MHVMLIKKRNFLIELIQYLLAINSQYRPSVVFMKYKRHIPCQIQEPREVSEYLKETI